MSIFTNLTEKIMHASTNHFIYFDADNRELKLSQQGLIILCSIAVGKSEHLKSLHALFQDQHVYLQMTFDQGESQSALLLPYGLTIYHSRLHIECDVINGRIGPNNFVHYADQGRKKGVLTISHLMNGKRFLSYLEERGIQLEGQFIPSKVDYNSLVFDLGHIVPKGHNLDAFHLFRSFAHLSDNF
jgi:hypothetical protein